MLFALIAAAVVSTAPVLSPFEFKVHPDSATWTVQPVGTPEDTAHYELKALRVLENGKLIQEIVLEHTEVLYINAGWIEVEDYDFDGLHDLYIATIGGSGGVPGFLLRFDPKTRRFRKPVSLSNTDLDPKKRLVHIGWRWGYCCGWDKEVRFIPGQDEPIVLRSWDRSRENIDSSIIETIEERDAKGKMKLLCRNELEDSVEQPVLRVLEGDLKRCLREREN